MKQLNLFAEETQLERLSKLRDSSERLKIIDFESFRPLLAESLIMEKLFAQFNRVLEEQGIITHTGTIVDATFVDAPRQRNSCDENGKIKTVRFPMIGRENLTN